MTTRPCGCPDFTLSRRRFLTAAAAGAGVMTAGRLFGEAFRQVSYGAEAGGNVLVVLSLRGGSDGLSLVVPRFADDQAALDVLRPTIGVPTASLVGGDEGFGLHPALDPLVAMWNAKTFGAVHAVGLPAPNRSHFDAMAAVEDADPGTSQRIGWINRMVGATGATRPETAVQLGSTLVPTSLTGPAPALGAYRVGDLELTDLDTGAQARRESMTMMWQGQTGVLATSIRATVDTVQRLEGLVDSAADDAPGGSVVHTAAYPAGPLREVLANTAALIRADVGTKVVTVDYGDWDMHTGLGEGDRDPSKGWMADHAGHLAASLKAFFADLGTAAGRVTLVTISEFGRRVEENGDHGVDHGYGNVMLLLGAGVKGGQVHGTWPGISRPRLNEGDLQVTTDYRTVLWEVMARLFPEVSGQKATIFPGLGSATVGVMA